MCIHAAKSNSLTHIWQMLRRAYPVVLHHSQFNVPCPPTHLGSVCPKSSGTVSAAGEPRQYQPICPCPQATVPILNCLIINDHADKRREMPLRWAGLQVHGCFSLVDCLSLYLFVVCCPPHQPPAHTLCGRHEGALCLQSQLLLLYKAKQYGFIVSITSCFIFLLCSFLSLTFV